MNVPAPELEKRQRHAMRLALFRFVAFVAALTAVIYAVLHWPKQQFPAVELTKDRWVYIAPPQDPARKMPEPTVAKSVAPNEKDPILAAYRFRPGQIVSGPENGAYQVRYGLLSDERLVFSDATEKRLNSTDWIVPAPWLRPCPPEQDDVDSNYEGVIRAWVGTEASRLEDQTVHAARVGDTVTVEVKNFDRWIFQQMDFGRFTEDLNELDPNFQSYAKRAIAARCSVQFFLMLKHVNQLLRVEMKQDEETRARAWGVLEKMITSDVIFSAIVDGGRQPGSDPSVPYIDWKSVENRAAELQKLSERIGPVQMWTYKIVQKRFSQLTLSFNGVTLHGVTPRNAYNDAEVRRERRASFRDDTYHWIRFELERRTAKGDAGQVNEADLANANAWMHLLGRPRLKESVRLTLALPSLGLELQTKVRPPSLTPDGSVAPNEFFHVGIRDEVLYATLGGFVCLLGILVWLARTTNILRDSSGAIRPDGIGPVSLAKTQMAFWFILNAAAFGFLWVTTGEIDTINKTCLVLLGIGTGTALGAALIPSLAGGAKSRRNYLVETALNYTRKEVAEELRDAVVERLRLLWLETTAEASEARKRIVEVLRKVMKQPQYDELAEKLGLPAEKAAIQTDREIITALRLLAKDLRRLERTSETDALLEETELLAKQMKDFGAMERTPLRRLLSDLLNESPAGGSYEFHRFQMVGWTLLLGLVFLVKLLNDRAMPEFGDTTLALLGISGGTYLGFKFPAVKGAAEPRKEEAAGS